MNHNCFDSCRRQACHGYCSCQLWTTDGNISAVIVCVLSDFVPWLQMRFCLLDRFSTHFNSCFSFPFKHLHMSVSQFFSHSCGDCSLFFLEGTRRAVPVQYLTNFWRVYTLKTSLFFQLLKNHNMYLLNLNQLPFQMFHPASLVNYLAFCNAVVDNWAPICGGGVGGEGGGRGDVELSAVHLLLPLYYYSLRNL